MVKNKIVDTINKYKMIESGEGIVVGVSGGPDSMCLLNNLISINNDAKINLNFKLYVAHINHMMREEADIETEYVKSYCEKNGIDCYIKKIDVKEMAKSEKIGTEEAGRKVIEKLELFSILANIGDAMTDAFISYRDEVKSKAYPAEEHTFKIEDEIMEDMGDVT